MPRNRKGIRECNLPGNRCIRGRDTRITYLYAISTETASRQRAREEGGGKRERDRSRTRLGRYLGTRDSHHAASRRFSRQQLVTETDLSADSGERGNERVEREKREREREGPEPERSWQSLEGRNE